MTAANEPTLELARQLDQQDPLAELRGDFYLRDGIYLDGNSLGLLSRSAEAALLAALDEWKGQAIGGWLDAAPPWFDLAERLGSRLAPLLGAQADEVVVTNSTTVNLHQCLATFYQPNDGATQILIDELAFPTDRYAVESHLRLVGRNTERDLLVVPCPDGLTIDEDAVIDRFSGEVQLVVLPTVVYTSGQLLDMERIVEAAHRRDILVGWDCSHSVGALPHEFSACGVDFAFGCTYKYLNGGPGSTGFLYLNRQHFDRFPGLAGWFGHRKETMFEMPRTLDPASSAGRLQIGTPPILSMAPLWGSLDLIERAGLGRLRSKSLRLTDLLTACAHAFLARHGVHPVELAPERRGGHVVLLHPQAKQISAALRARGVVPDYRPPNMVRLCPAALYTTFVECYEAIRQLEQILDTHEFAKFAGDQDRIP